VSSPRHQVEDRCTGVREKGRQVKRERLGDALLSAAVNGAGKFPGETEVEPPLVVRLASGRLTAEMAAVRRRFGFEDGMASPESP
jgi:hypothetical protein